MTGEELIKSLTDEQIEWIYTNFQTVNAERRKRTQVEFKKMSLHTVGTCLYMHDKYDDLYTFERIVGYEEGYYSVEIVEVFTDGQTVKNVYSYTSEKVPVIKYTLGNYHEFPNVQFEELKAKGDEYNQEIKRVNNEFGKVFSNYLNNKKLWKNY